MTIMSITWAYGPTWVVYGRGRCLCLLWYFVLILFWCMLMFLLLSRFYRRWMYEIGFRFFIHRTLRISCIVSWCCHLLRTKKKRISYVIFKSLQRLNSYQNYHRNIMARKVLLKYRNACIICREISLNK